MSTLHVRHIKNFLERSYQGKIDLTDVANRSEEERESHFLTRSLSAFVLNCFSESSGDRAGQFVVDGFEDNGIDAAYYDRVTNHLILVQSKWIQSGTGCPEIGDVKKFLDGVKDLIDGRFERFNDRLRRHESDIQMALDDIKVKLKLVLAYTGGNDSTHIQRDVQDFLAEVNSPSNYAEFITWNLPVIHKSVAGEVSTAEVNFELLLVEWGKFEGPLKAFYGQVNCRELAAIYERFEGKMLHKNIRSFLGDTEINREIQATLSTEPTNFWYYNNGITIVCDTVEKTLMGGNDRASGTFNCTHSQIVNGAQTVGNLLQILRTTPQNLDNAKVTVRLIALNASIEDMGVKITRSTNTQNKVERKDFVALDPVQDRLKSELYLDNISYVFRSGETPNPLVQESFGFEEAISALACIKGPLPNAITAKREIGKLWERIDAPPYTTYFNAELNSQKLWRYVSLARKVEASLKRYHADRGDRRNLAVHGNKLIQYVVFQVLPRSLAENPQASIDSEIERYTPIVHEAVLAAKLEIFPDSIFGRLFYNSTKTTTLCEKVLERVQYQPVP